MASLGIIKELSVLAPPSFAVVWPVCEEAVDEKWGLFVNMMFMGSKLTLYEILHLWGLQRSL